jgi:hypothetical protein
MTTLPYAKNIVTDTREYTKEEIAMIQEMMKKDPPIKSTIEMIRLLWMDDTKVKGATFYMECIWLWGGKTTSGTTEAPHQHAHDEVIGFISSDPDNPKELDARMEIILGDETHFLTKSCLVYIPAGMKHCPLTFREVNRPVFFFTLMPISRYGRKSENPEGRKEPEIKIPKLKAPPIGKDGTKYGRYIITEPKSHVPPSMRDKPTPPPPRPRTAKTNQIVSLDGEVHKGAFYVDFVWIWSGDMTMAPEAHAHDWDEMIGLVSGPDKHNPREIIGDVSINMGKEDYKIKKSSLVFVPKGVMHCPIEFKNIKRPVLCFTIGNTPQWSRAGTTKKS